MTKGTSDVRADDGTPSEAYGADAEAKDDAAEAEGAEVDGPTTVEANGADEDAAGGEAE